MKPYLLGSMTALLLAACASAPATQYYRLANSNYHIQHLHKPSMVVDVVLSEPVKGQALLYQPNGHTLHFAKQHLWGQPLHDAIRNRLANDMNQQMSAWVFVPSELKTQATDAVLTVYVEDFQGRFDGQTQISGFTKITVGGKSRAGTSFKVLTPQQGDGYAAMVDSLNLGLSQVAQEVLPR